MNERNTPNYDLIFPLIPILAFVLGGLIVMIGILATGQNAGSQPTAVEEIVSAEEVAAQSASEVEVVDESADEVEVADSGDSEAVEVAYDPAVVDDGRLQFQTACAACHGMDARGVAGLGKTLVGSEFVDSLTDPELHEFITVGRPIWDPLNTTGIAMPARGGNPALTDAHVDAIVAYIRTLNVDAVETVLDVEETGAETVNVPEEAPAEASEFEPLPVVLLGDTMEPYVREAIPAEAAYEGACANCHGEDGAGTGTWMGILESDLVTSGDEAALAEFITGNPGELMLPTDGFPHPQRGGYPALTDDEIAALAEYVLTLDDAE